MTLKLALLAVPLALVTSARAYRKGSLSRSGALAAVLVGSVSLTASIRLGCVLLVFFASSSKLTRVGSARKAELEGRNYAGPGGNRSAVQVLANSGAATLLAVAHLVLRGAHHRAAGARAWWAEPTEARLSFSGPLRALSLVQLAYVCHYACTTADTWASELGVLSRAPPRLITTGALVRPGTNGGVSPLGLGASLCGGLLIGVCYFLMGKALLPPAPPAAAPAATTAAATTATTAAAATTSDDEWFALVAAPLAGAFGSAVDSLLGAALQFSGYCAERKCVVEAPGPTVTRICGTPLLSNHGVNFAAALCTAAAAAAIVAAATSVR